MFAALNELTERRIDEARRQGAFDDLPGSGRPLGLDDDRLVPEDLRVAYRAAFLDRLACGRRRAAAQRRAFR